jgi:hypothetical protein
METLTIAVVLCYTAWNAVRFRTSIAWRSVLEEYEVQGGTAYLAFTGAFWTLLGLMLLFALLSGKRWAGRMLIASSLAYSLWYWMDRMLFQTPRHEWLISISLNALIVAILLRTGILMSREQHG